MTAHPPVVFGTTPRIDVDPSRPAMRPLHSARVILERGDILLREGEVSGLLYLLEDGALEVTRHDRGHEISIGTVTAGTLLGELSALHGTPHTATLRAAEPCVLRSFSHELLDQLNPGQATPRELMLGEVARSLGNHLRRGTDRTVDALRNEIDLLRLHNTTTSFLVYVLLGLAAYAVTMKSLVEHDVSVHNSTLLTGPMLVLMALAAILWGRHNGLPAQTFGLSWTNVARHIREAVVWTIPAAIVITLGKWAYISLQPELAAEPLFTVLHTPFSPPKAIGYLVYAGLVPVQEFIARGAIQGPLFQFIKGPLHRRGVISIVVSNALFAVTHLHLTVTYGVAAATGGLLWGVLYARQKSLVGPIVSHALLGVYALWALGFDRLLQN